MFSGLGALIFILSYLCGSLPSGYLIGKFNGIDIRQHGSKNIGATNVRRVLGKGWGRLCFLLDFAKGLVAVIGVGKHFGNEPSLGWATGAFIAAVAVVCGHVFPVWLKFKGGKGVATALGVTAGIAFWPLLFGVVAWLVVFAVKRIVSLASMGAMVVVAFSALVCQLADWHRSGWPCVGLFWLIALIVIIRHKDNIIRLKNGTENVFKRPSK